MGRVARLPVAVCLFAGLAVADVPHPLDDPVGVVFAGVRLSAGGEGEPRPTVAAKDVSRQEGLSADIAGDRALLFSRVGAARADVLGGFKQLRGNDL